MSAHHQKGFTIIELIIGLAIIATVIASVFKMQTQNTVIETARINAENLAAFQKLAAQYIIANKSGIITATQDGSTAQQHCVIGATGYDTGSGNLTGGSIANDLTLHTCAFDAILLYQKGLWPSLAVPAANADRWVAIVRQIYSGSPATPTGNLEVIFVKASGTGNLAGNGIIPWSKDPMKSLAANEAAKVLGGTGGAIPVGNTGVCQATKAGAVQACGNGWKVDLSQFISGSQLTTVKNALP